MCITNIVNGRNSRDGESLFRQVRMILTNQLAVNLSIAATCIAATCIAVTCIAVMCPNTLSPFP